MIDGIPVQAALIDGDGRIVAVNAYWRNFAEANDYGDAACGLGANYVDVCRTASGSFSAEARLVGNELRDVLTGRRDEFSMVYPCHSPTERRWFRLLAAGTRTPAGAVILHFNITPEMLAEEREVASRIEAERKLSQFEKSLEKRSREELRTLESMSDEPPGESDVDAGLWTAYCEMIDTVKVRKGSVFDRAIGEMARALGQRLAEQGAQASDVARLHARALADATRTVSPERAAWLVQESRMAFIGVLGNLADAYRRTR